jgi:hypothetical protein
MHAAGATAVEGAEATKLLLFQAPGFAAAEQEAEAQGHVHSAFDATVDVPIGEDAAGRAKGS